MSAAGFAAATASIALLGCTFPVEDFSAEPEGEGGVFAADEYRPLPDAAVGDARKTHDDDKGKGHHK